MNWRTWFGGAMKDREQITKAYIDELTRNVPGLRIKHEAPDHLQLIFPDGKDAQSFLENLWIRCEGQNLTEQKETIRIMASGIVEMWKPPELLIQTVIPVVRSTEFVKKVGETVLAADRIVGDFWMVYVSDTPTSMRTIRRDELQALGYEGNELKKITIANLERVLPPIEVHQQDGCALIVAGADYPTSLIFIERIRAEMEKMFGQGFVIAVPSRDVLMIAKADRPDAIERIKSQGAKIFQSAPYNISPDLLTWTGSEWKLY